MDTSWGYKVSRSDLGYYDLILSSRIIVSGVSTILCKVGIPNLLCGFLMFRKQSVAYCFPGHCELDLDLWLL